MSLNNKIEIHNDFDSGEPIDVIRVEHIKEFIKQIKNGYWSGITKGLLFEKIDKFAGDKLT